jgi:hypothetical protein
MLKNNHTSNSITPFENNQFQAVYKAFYNRPSTMKMVDKETGVMRENVCRYCGMLRKSGRLYQVKKGICPETKHRAIYWTTNPDLIPDSNQLSLF